MSNEEEERRRAHERGHGVTAAVRRVAEMAETAERATPRISDEERVAKEAILGALHDSRGEINKRYVVEGSFVVCTSMEEDKSSSRMEKLDPETKEMRRAIISRVNPDRYGGYRREVTAAEWYRDVPNEGMVGDIFHMNGPRLLDHLDIEFSPVFGEEEIPEGVANSIFPTSIIAPCLLDGKCKNSDDGKCKPDIEELMWQNCTRDDSVDVAGGDTLLERDAYMFCHHGQGILYIENSRQHLPGVVEPERIPREDWDNLNNAVEETNTRIQGIVIHHTYTSTDASVLEMARYHRYRAEGTGWAGGIGYHFLIRDNGLIYDGRPMDERGIHTGDDRNYTHIGIALIGNYCPLTNGDQDDKPPAEQLDSLFWLIRHIKANVSSVREGNGSIDNIQPHWDDYNIPRRRYDREGNYIHTSYSCPGPWYDDHDWNEFL